MKKINVLSLFDGISCGRLALSRLNAKIDKYFASEIDKYAIEITKKNFPDIIHVGDVKNVKGKDFPEIYLLIGGSPCQNLSMAVINNIKYNNGLEGEKSGLFYEYLRVLKEVKPKYFLLENVGGMTNKNKDLISYALGVEPIMINSNLLSAQDRKRYYWTNIQNIEQPEDKGLILSDIILQEQQVDKKYFYKQDFDYISDNAKVQAILNVNGHDILRRVYNIKGKCATLTCCRGGYKQKKIYQNGLCRKLTPLEYERLQTIPDNYTFGVSDSQRYNLLGNAWTVEVIKHILKNIFNN